MPGRVRDQSGENDGPHAFGDDEAEERVQNRNQKNQHQELPQLHAYVEGEQRGEHVAAPELERLAERERESKSVDQSKAEGDDPAPMHVRRSHNVLERHVDDRRSN